MAAKRAKMSIIGSVAAATETDNNTTASVSHTLSSGQNRTVFCAVGVGDNGLAADDVSGVTYGGVAMNQVDQTSNTNGTDRNSTGLYWLKVADTVAAGAKTVTATSAGNCVVVRLVVFELANVHPSAVEDVVVNVSNANGAASVTQSRTTVSDRAWVLQVITTDRNTATITPTSGQNTIDNTVIINGTNDLVIFVGYSESDPAGATAMNANFGVATDYVSTVWGIKSRRRKFHVV